MWYSYYDDTLIRYCSGLFFFLVYNDLYCTLSINFFRNYFSQFDKKLKTIFFTHCLWKKWHNKMSRLFKKGTIQFLTRRIVIHLWLCIRTLYHLIVVVCGAYTLVCKRRPYPHVVRDGVWTMTEGRGKEKPFFEKLWPRATCAFS